MSIPPEKKAELKQVIHDQLTQVNIHEKIKETVSRNINNLNKSKNTDKQQITEDDIMAELCRKGVVDDILKKLKLQSPVYLEPTKEATHANIDEEVLKAEIVEKVAVDPTRRYLYLQILGGKAFIEHLTAFDSKTNDSFFYLNLHFRSQRFSSKPVPVSVEPNIRDGFLFELRSNEHGGGCQLMSKETLLSFCDPIHLVLIKHDADGCISLVSSYSLEWRKTLTCGKTAITSRLELMGVGSECKVPIGVLDIRMEIVPRSPSLSIPPQVVDAQLRLEHQRAAERERLFLVYAKQWWKEYLEIREEHKNRTVKIFAQDETGVNRCVCCYVEPLRSSRIISSPKIATRFVSAFPYEKHSIVGISTRCEQWLSTHAFLAAKKGDHQDHSNLLCSLLLGFGLDAYVCVGVKDNGAAYTWVLLSYTDGTVYFIDSVLGIRYSHHIVNPNDPPITKQPENKYNFKSIGCVYNHKSFYANCQPLDSVETCHFNFKNQSSWKRMTIEAIKSIAIYPNICRPLPPLTTPTFDPILISNSLEHDLMKMISSHRKEMRLSCEWDEDLSFLLSSALWSYEVERCSSVANIGNSEFQDAVKRNVPEGHTFKGFPIQFHHHDASRMFCTCLKSNVCSDIIECRGDVVRLALRAYVCVFPDDIVVTWLMLACKYRSVL